MMIDVNKAIGIVLNKKVDFGVEKIPFDRSVGRVLAEDSIADRPLPPFDRVMMDGVAIDYQSFASGKRQFEVESVGAAGHPQQKLIDPTKCIEIMTGAALPIGTDTVVRYEDLEPIENSFVINAEVKQGQNIHLNGSDFKNGNILLQAGTKIKAIDVNVLATVGQFMVKVKKNPSVAVISSGDELVQVEVSPKAYQIRMSNVHMLCARLDELQVANKHFHIIDSKEEIRKKLQEIIQSFDVVLLSGGVSKGKFDYIPEVLESLGVVKSFHRVAQRPGKPFWFGAKEKTTIFAFPGNPVSTLACFHKYFIPWFLMSMGIDRRPMYAKLHKDVHFKPRLTYFAQAKVDFQNGEVIATVSKGNGSGDMVHPSKMDGFLELPLDRSVFLRGEVFEFIPFHPITI